MLSRGVMNLPWRFTVFIFSGSCLAAMACKGKDPEQFPEWSPEDHDNQEQPNAGQVDTEKPRPGMPNMERLGINDVVLATWKQNCVPCHGVIGRGDGPQGMAMRPRDLTDPTWQRVAIDSEIAHTIRKGRGRMPGFPNIPEETVTGLIRLVRMLNAEPRTAATADASSDPHAAPGAANRPPLPSGHPAMRDTSSAPPASSR